MTRHMKKIFVALLCAMLAGLCACGQAAPEKLGAAETTSKSTTIETTRPEPVTVIVDPAKLVESDQVEDRYWQEAIAKHNDTNSIIYCFRQTYLDQWEREVFRCWPKFTNEAGKQAAARLNAYYEAEAAKPCDDDWLLIQPGDILYDSAMFASWYDFLLFDLELQRDYVIVHFYGDGYSGGAHPYHVQWADVFDRSTGKKLVLGDVLNLKASADAINRTVTEHIVEFGWSSSDNESYDIRALPEQNFAVTEQGVVLIFGEYEIAPYAAGIIEVPIPWESLIR